MKQVRSVILLVFFVLFSPLCQARLLQIIHTNDLHSYFTGYWDGRGGYARVMTKIKQLREEAQAKGLETLQLDGGDWGEGTSFFISGRGSTSIKALDMLGAEVAVIGNHDHMMGGNVLGQQIRKANPKTKFLSANIVQTPDMELGDLVKPYIDLERAGIKIRIIGLSTAAPHFQYQVLPGRILPPQPIGAALGDAAKKEGKELVIALTHIGLSEDQYLAKYSSGIDVIVGGHSHTRLNEVKRVRNRKGKYVPIVQAWAHGLVVGTLLLDVKDDGSGVEVVEYKLHEVAPPIAADREMARYVAEAADNRNQYFGGRWNEIIGETLTPMSGYQDGHSSNSSSCWGRHLANATKKAGNAHVGIHLAAFEGMYKPPGPISYGDIVDNFPHIRKYGDQGWEIATTKMSGWVLKPLMWYVSRMGYGVSFSGLGYGALVPSPENTLIDGEPVEDKAIYTIAFPHEVALAIKRSFPRYRRYLAGLRSTGKFYWPVIEEYVKENTPISCR